MANTYVGIFHQITRILSDSVQLLEYAIPLWTPSVRHRLLSLFKAGAAAFNDFEFPFPGMLMMTIFIKEEVDDNNNNDGEMDEDNKDKDNNYGVFLCFWVIFFGDFSPFNASLRESHSDGPRL